MLAGNGCAVAYPFFVGVLWRLALKRGWRFVLCYAFFLLNMFIMKINILKILTL